MNHSKKHKKPPRLETRPSTRTQETQLAMTDQRQKAIMNAAWLSSVRDGFRCTAFG